MVLGGGDAGCRLLSGRRRLRYYRQPLWSRARFHNDTKDASLSISTQAWRICC